MDATRYGYLSGVLATVGLGAWLVLRSGDPMEAVLWRDAIWGLAIASGAYGSGLSRGRRHR